MIDLILTFDGNVIHQSSLAPGDYIIGRDLDVEIMADVPDLSRRHARLSLRDDDILIEDLGSSNGTWVDGKQVTGPVSIAGSFPVSLGDVWLEIRGDISAGGGFRAGPEADGMPGELLAKERYVAGSIVAHGGMGNILEARQTGMRREVAMKVIRGNASSDSLRRFVNEARITGELEHPNIVPVHELGMDADGQVFYTMKFVRGHTLAEVLASDPARVAEHHPLPFLLTVFQKVCDAIAFAHSRGIIHRDLKPDNIMLGDFGEVLVMDWGLAKRRSILDEGNSFTEDGFPAPGTNTLKGSVLGTPRYMSPEQARGEIDLLDERSDIYALGVILHELLYLRPIVSAPDTYALVEKVANGVRDKLPGDWKSPHLPGGRVPPSLRAVRRKALALDPGNRYQSVGELQADLSAYQAGFATGAEGAGLGTQLALLVKRHRGVSTSIGIGLTLLAGTVLMYTSMVVAERNRATSALAREEAEHRRAEEALQREEIARQETDREKDRAVAALAEAEAANRRHLAARAEAERFHGTTTAMRERVAQAIKEMPDAEKLYRLLSDEALRSGRVEEALANINRSIALNPGSADHLTARANLLQAAGRFSQAIPDYRRALAIRPDPQAEESLALSERLLKERQESSTGDAEVKTLLDKFLKEQGRVEALLLDDIFKPEPASRTLTPDEYSPEAQLLYEMLTPYTSQQGWRKDRIKTLPDGTLHLNLDRLKFSGLSMIRGSRVTELNISHTDCRALSAIRGLPLIWLAMNDTPVSNLSPLAGMPLRKLICHHTSVRDFSPLATCPLVVLDCGYRTTGDLTGLQGIKSLSELYASGNNVTDLSPLAGMPLKYLDIAGAEGVRDFSPVGTLPELEKIAFPHQACGLGSLKQLSKLQWVGHPRFRGGWIPAMDFIPLSDATDSAWSKLGPELAKTGARDLRPDRLTVREPRKVDLDLRGTGIQDLTPLAQFTPYRLWLDTPSSGVNLAPLAGKPGLVHLSLEGTTVAELRALLPGSKLESIVLNHAAKDANSLERHPTLTHIGYKLDEGLKGPSTTRAEFFSARKPDDCDPREGEGERSGVIAAERFDDFSHGASGWKCTGQQPEKDLAAWTADLTTMNGRRGGGCLAATDFPPGHAWFRAPAPFLGDRSGAFGGCLEFHVRRRNFKSDPHVPDVEIASGSLRLVRKAGLPDMKGWYPVLIPLVADGNWKNGDLNGPAATGEQLRSVLSDLKELNIRARHDAARNAWTDLDDVILWSPDGATARMEVDTEWKRTMEEKSSWLKNAEVKTTAETGSHHPEYYDRAWLRKDGSILASGFDGYTYPLVVHPLGQNIPATIRIPSPGKMPEGTMLAFDVRGSDVRPGNLIRVLLGQRQAASVEVDDHWTTVMVPWTSADEGTPVTIEIHARDWAWEHCFIHHVRFVKTLALVSTSEQSPQTWRYTTEKPSGDWHAADFDDSAWKKGEGGFGSQGKAGAHIRTEWRTSDIWLRRSFQADPAGIKRLSLRVNHDDNYEIFINGVKVSERGKWTADGYADMEISPETLKAGTNHIAVHCQNNAGTPQYIDAGLNVETAP